MGRLIDPSVLETYSAISFFVFLDARSASISTRADRGG